MSLSWTSSGMPLLSSSAPKPGDLRLSGFFRGYQCGVIRRQAVCWILACLGMVWFGCFCLSKAFFRDCETHRKVCSHGLTESPVVFSNQSSSYLGRVCIRPRQRQRVSKNQAVRARECLPPWSRIRFLWVTALSPAWHLLGFADFVAYDRQVIAGLLMMSTTSCRCCRTAWILHHNSYMLGVLVSKAAMSGGDGIVIDDLCV